MEINWPQLLDQIQDLRSALETWGITYEILMALGVAAFALFLISLREVVVWYLKISQLQAQMLQMSRQLSQIQSSVDQARGPIFKEDKPKEDKPAETKEEAAVAAARKKFNLDH
jgi:biopolymer transport protein ExbB/TolQ